MSRDPLRYALAHGVHGPFGGGGIYTCPTDRPLPGIGRCDVGAITCPFFFGLGRYAPTFLAPHAECPPSRCGLRPPGNGDALFAVGPPLSARAPRCLGGIYLDKVGLRLLARHPDPSGASSTPRPRHLLTYMTTRPPSLGPGGRHSYFITCSDARQMPRLSGTGG